MLLYHESLHMEYDNVVDLKLTTFLYLSFLSLDIKAGVLTFPIRIPAEEWVWNAPSTRVLIRDSGNRLPSLSGLHT
jgi:hypothetical protein